MFPSSEASYLKTNTKNRRKSEKLNPRGSNHAPWAHVMSLGYGKKLPCALGISKVALGAPWACSMCPKHLGAGVILCFLWVKLTFLAQTQLETLTINTILPHSEFLVQNCGSSIGRQLWSFRRVSIFSLIFKVYFYL